MTAYQEERAAAIIARVADFYRLSPSDLYGRSRRRPVATARHIAMYLCRKMLPDLRLADVGAFFGGRDHSTVIQSGYALEDLIDTDAGIRGDVEYLWTSMALRKAA